MSCPDFYWNNTSVSSLALHNLTTLCPNISSNPNDTQMSMVIEDLDSPATFLIQLVRLSLSLAILTLVAALYNCVSVLERNLLSTATCSLHWIIYLLLFAIKAAVLMILIPLAKINQEVFNQIGFILTSLIQAALTFVLFIALDHERRFRSPDFASIDSPTSHCCVGLKLRVLFSKLRVVVLLLSLLPVALLIALEVTFAVNENKAPSPLAWVYMLSLLCVRVIVVATVVSMLFFTKGQGEPTIAAKVYLTVASILSVCEDLPNSLLAVSVYQPSSCEQLECTLDVMTAYDLFQLLGALSLVFYALFVRSQYLRIEEECKLVLVWDMQKLLQVNGRRNIIKHYT